MLECSIQAPSGDIGQLKDFVIDLDAGVVRELVVRTGHRYSPVETAAHTRSIAVISLEYQMVTIRNNYRVMLGAA